MYTQLKQRVREVLKMTCSAYLHLINCSSTFFSLPADAEDIGLRRFSHLFVVLTVSNVGLVLILAASLPSLVRVKKIKSVKYIAPG